jgi:hypothetical protein
MCSNNFEGLKSCKIDSGVSCIVDGIVRREKCDSQDGVVVY